MDSLQIPSIRTQFRDIEFLKGRDNALAYLIGVDDILTFIQDIVENSSEEDLSETISDFIDKIRNEWLELIV